MYTVRQSSRAVLVFGLIGVLSGYAWAAGRSDTNGSSREFNKHHSRVSRHEANVQTSNVGLERASKLIGEPVRGSDGKKLGTIYDVVLTPDLNSVSYVALVRDGAFGLNRELYAVPWSAFHEGVGNRYYLPITLSQLEAKQTFKEGYWPTVASSDWATTCSATPADQTATRIDRRDIRDRRVSKLIGTNVRDVHNVRSGDIKDVMISADTGQIAYTIITHGGLFGLGAKYSAVPPTAINLQPGRRVATLTVDRNTLIANSFSPMRWPDLSSPSFEQRTAALYSTRQGGTVLGYVPPQSSVNAEPKEEGKVSKAPAARSTEPSKEYEGSALGYQAPAPTRDYEELSEVSPSSGVLGFNPDRVRTIEGIVVDTGKLGGRAASAGMLALRLKTADDKIITVNLGPRDYVSRQNFYIVDGDHIAVTGADVTIQGRPVFLATQIKSDGQTLALRDSSGHPLWLRSGSTNANERANVTTPMSEEESSMNMDRAPEHAQPCP
jgi:sporulation protein YlmC with PRC-barrel domain